MTNQILSTLPLNPGGEVSGWGLRAAWVGAESSHVRLDSWRLQGPTAAGESHQICACNDLFSLHPTSDVFHLTDQFTRTGTCCSHEISPQETRSWIENLTQR